ncbi:cupin domain-containing protein [Streptomyces mobaraensis]|uniref:cupin domain-containing protein n=1 Tax=Streptomyces mobaraensis TaxID=35621 RepID=UPI003316C4C8
MTSVRIAERLGEEVLAQALHRDFRHMPAAIDPAGLLTWDDLNAILAAHRLDPPRLRLSQDGETLPQRSYSEPVTTRRHTVWHRLHPALLHARLAEGASLALDQADELHRPVAVLAEEFERIFRTRFQANVYASWTATEGFGTHWDDHDVLVAQVDGAKRWRIYGPTRRHPLYRDTSEPGPPPADPVADLVLHPGDLLYVPRGWWHAVTADQGIPSLHVTYGFQTHTPSDLMSFVCEQLLGHAEFRADLPLAAGPDVQSAFLAEVRKLVGEQLDDPRLLARYVEAMDGRDMGRMAPSLPYLTGVPADPDVRVRMTTARAVLTTTEDTVALAAAGHSYEFASAAGPALAMLVTDGEHRVGDLARAAGITAADAAGLVQVLVDGQAAALTWAAR